MTKLLNKINTKKVLMQSLFWLPVILLVVFLPVYFYYIQPMMNVSTSAFRAVGDTVDSTIVGNVAVIGGGIAAIGMLGAGIGQGYATGKAAEAVSRNPEAEAKIRSLFLIGIAITESSALYAFVIAIVAVFVA